MPAGLPPSAVSASGCAFAPSTSARSLRRTHFGKVTGSVQTRSKPSSANFAFAHSTARASASLPARRGPTSVVRDSVMSQARLLASAVSRSWAATVIEASLMRVSGAAGATLAAGVLAASAATVAAAGRWTTAAIAAASNIGTRRMALRCI